MIDPLTLTMAAADAAAGFAGVVLRLRARRRRRAAARLLAALHPAPRHEVGPAFRVRVVPPIMLSQSSGTLFDFTVKPHADPPDAAPDPPDAAPDPHLGYWPPGDPHWVGFHE